MDILSLSALLPALRMAVARLARMQTTDGGLRSPEYGMPDAKLTGQFIMAGGLLLLAESSAEETMDAQLLAQLEQAAGFMLQARRPSGNLDLLSVNYDSGPDTGFTVQQFCPLFELGRDRLACHPMGVRFLAKLEAWIRGAVQGMSVGGFHTPNHRWVIVSALTQAHTIFPDLDVAQVVQAYLAEGYDIDPEGFFIERSVGVYDAVNSRSLLFIAENWESPEALDAVSACLTTDLHLLHADGTAETGLSRRQDYGTRTVPVGLVDCYLRSHFARPNPLFVQAARTLWQQSAFASGDGGANLTWVVYTLLKHGTPPAGAGNLPTNFARHFPANGLWRVRRESLNVSLFQGVTRLLTLTHGQAELSSVKVSFTYFGGPCGHFIGDSLTVEDGEATLRSEGLGRPRRPGYELPLGRPISPEQWSQSMGQRELYPLPPLTSTLEMTEADGGVNLHLRTLDGLDGVAAQIALDFPPGGVWETEDTRTMPAAGQTLFLKSGYGEMRYGEDVIRVGPGSNGHAMFAMRDAELAPNHVRVLIALVTPVDVRVAVRAG